MGWREEEGTKNSEKHLRERSRSEREEEEVLHGTADILAASEKAHAAADFPDKNYSPWRAHIGADFS